MALALVIVGAVGLLLRLASGPIELPVPQVLLDGIAAEAPPGWRVDAEGLRLDLSRETDLNGVQLRDVTVFDAGGGRALEVPLLALRFALSPSLDPYEAVRVREVILQGAAVAVVKDAEGRYQFDIGDSHTEGDPLAALMEEDVLDLLPQLRVEDATLTYTNMIRGSTWHAEDAQLTLDPSSDGLRGTLSLAMADGSGDATLEAFRARENGDSEAVLTLNRMTPARISGMHPVLAPLARIDAPLTGSVSAKALADGEITALAADLEAGSGQVFLEEGVATELNALAVRLQCDPRLRSCAIEHLAVDVPAFSGSVKGGVREVEPDRYRAELAVAAPRLLSVPDASNASAERGTVAFEFDAASDRFRIEQAVLENVQVPSVEGAGVLSAARAVVSGNFDMAAEIAAIPSLRLDGVTGSLADGGRFSATQLRAETRYEAQANRVDIGSLTLTDPAVETPQGAARAASLTVQGSADLAAGRVTVAALDAQAVALADPAHPLPITAAALRTNGTLDLETGAFTGVHLAAEAVHLPLPELYDTPLAVTRAEATGSVFSETGAIRIGLDTATAEIEGLPARANGTFYLRDAGGLAGQINTTLGPVDFRRVPRFWPKGVAPGGLRWVAENVQHGQVDALTISAAFDAADPARDRMDLSFDFRDTALTFTPQMPPIEQAHGRGVATLHRFDLKLHGGQVAVPGAGALLLSDSDFVIDDFAPDIPTGEVRLRVAGALRSILGLLDHPPLGIVAQSGLDLAGLEGGADANVVLRIPLAENLLVEDVAFEGRAELRDYRVTEPKTGLPITGDLMRITATSDGLQLDSDAQIEGLSARIGYSQEFARPQPGEPDSRLRFESFLTTDQLVRYGLDLGDSAQGLAAVSGHVDLFADGTTRFTADADLTNTELALERLGWRKPQGQPATLAVSGSRMPDGAAQIDALNLRGEGLAAEGSLSVDGAGEIGSAEFRRISLGSGNEIGLRYTRKTDGHGGLRIEGPRLDLRGPFARAIKGTGRPRSPGAAPTGPVTDITVAVDRVLLRDNLTLLGMSGAIRLLGETPVLADLEGSLNGAAPARLHTERNRDGTVFRLTSSDAGGFLRAADLFKGAQGGTMALDGRTFDTVSPSQIRGVIRFDDVVMRDGETMRRILSGGAIGSLLRQMAAGGLSFTKIELPFNGVGSLWRIQDGVAYGPSLGLTLSGDYDLAARYLDLDGSISPAYAINGALGNVPLLGTLLTGGEGEGLFGVTFSVEGDADSPSVRVNPLTALAPGFLRKIVSKVGGGGTTPGRDPNEEPRFKSGRDN